MLSRPFLESDAFLELPVSAKLLYVYLDLNGDDDGFIDSPKRIARMIGATEDDLKLLVVKYYVIAFESGVVVIRHWKQHNTLRNDRYKATKYQAEKSLLQEDSSGIYSLHIKSGIPSDNQVPTVGSQMVCVTELNLTEQNVSTLSAHSNADVAACAVSKSEIDKFFESIWALYPEKKGKGQISDKQKRALFDIGFDAIVQCVERYRTDKPSDYRWQYGSTFFNSGYLDYLDENYEKPVGTNMSARSDYSAGEDFTEDWSEYS